jgi:electron transport complex protein RnfC
VRRPGLYRIPLGTRYADILHHVGITGSLTRVIDGGLLTGRPVEHLDMVTTHETAGVIALDARHDHLSTPGPCIHCGWCQEDCPVGLDPRTLLDLYEREKYQQALHFYPHACIECGLCSYVCPAELPLTQAAVALKNLMPLVGRANGGSPQ